jgi:5-methylcytosine-specific restriction endonuclease McrA
MSRWVGNTGTVRLDGQDLTELREACFRRDEMRCCSCGLRVNANLPDWHPRRAHMAHIKSRGAGGSDILSNVRLLCAECHLVKEHAYGPSGEKPCPPKHSAFTSSDEIVRKFPKL